MMIMDVKKRQAYLVVGDGLGLVERFIGVASGRSLQTGTQLALRL
jgi:hypothetical protein